MLACLLQSRVCVHINVLYSWLPSDRAAAISIHGNFFVQTDNFLLAGES